jgi:trehalose 6-phosphate phosphatase
MKYLIFLDYDGTLSAIVKKPHLALLSKSRRDFLKRLNRNPNIMLVIVSGRMLKDLKKRVGLAGIYYAGNHGFEINGPKTKFVHPKARIAKPVLKIIKGKLKAALKGIKGVILEDKILTLSLHYRLVKESDLKRVKKAFRKIIGPFVHKNKIRLTYGKKVFEIRPNIKWDKGKAVLWFLKKFAQKTQNSLPIYIGDDTTDEDAFKALRKKGITIRVGKNQGSHAQYFIKDVNQVYKLLHELLNNLC